MFSLIFSLICASVFTLGASIDCSKGQTVWCSSLRAAKICNAIPHCRDSVWKNEVLTKDSDDVCTFCESIVGDIKNMLSNKETEEKIKQFLLSACSIIPSQELQQECENIANNYLAELIELIKEELDPSLVCSTMGLCKTSEIFKILKEDVSLPVKQVTGDICKDCKTFFGDIKAEILSNATEQQIIAEMDLALCSYLGELKSACEDLVAEYVPEIMQMIAQQYDPEMDCEALGFCTQTRESRYLLAKLRLQRSPLFKATKGESDEYCEECKLAISYVKGMLTDPAVKAEITQELNNMCNLLGGFKEKCLEMVKDYLPALLQVIDSELNADEDCKLIGLCSSVEFESYELIDLVPAKITQNDLKAFRQSGPKMSDVHSTAQCIMCEFVMKEIDDMLEENSTEAEIISALDKVCSILPATISQECQSFVNTYGPAVLVLIEDELTPDEVCQTLGLCSSKSKVVASQPKPKVEDGELCIVCETLVQYLDSLLAENATEQEIKDALEKVCNFVPTSFQQECDQIVAQYAPMIIQLIEKDLTPTQVCTELNLCTSETIKPTKAPLLGEEECSWGPAYWCASKENAAKCKAEKHCQMHVWN